MSEPLVFWMGKFAAELPRDRRYARNHMWAQRVEAGWRFGFTSYAVRLLQDVYFLDWIVDAGADVALRREIGQIESKKAESALYAPIAGVLVRFNEALLNDPSTINVDKYGAGWLFEMEGTGEGLLTSDEYYAYLESVWEVTQRTIKGQLNE